MSWVLVSFAETVTVASCSRAQISRSRARSFYSLHSLDSLRADSKLRYLGGVRVQTGERARARTSRHRSNAGGLVMTSEERSSGLYPALEAYKTGYLQVSGGHELFYEVSGLESISDDGAGGQTVVFLHGGPGGATRPDHRRFFDPLSYRIVLYDQRGCGKSRPHGYLEENTTQDLIWDLEALRTHLGIGKWGVFGGSWGSTLGLAYAQHHASNVSFLILRGIFLGRQQEIDWLYERCGAALLFPDAFQGYLSGLPMESRNAPSLLHAYHAVLSGPPSVERTIAARAFCHWEGALSYFPGRTLTRSVTKPSAQAEENSVIAVEGGVKEASPAALAVSRLESHYFVNSCFLREGQLLERELLDRVRHIPTAIIQGRWDFVCPASSAYELASAWPEAEFIVVGAAGHSAFEDGTRQALVRMTDKFRALGVGDR